MGIKYGFFFDNVDSESVWTLKNAPHPPLEGGVYWRDEKLKFLILTSFSGGFTIVDSESIWILKMDLNGGG